jgi:stage V sporulation protein B
MSISKLVASSKKSLSEAINYFMCGLAISVSISIFVAGLVFFNAHYIATRLLFEPRCESLIKYMSFSIPFASIHSCICGYYLGLKKTNIPAISQLVEQTTRAFSIYLIIMLLEHNNVAITPSIAVIGALIGEIASATYSIISIKCIKPKFPVLRNKINSIKNSSKQILILSLPLTLNKLMLSILQSMQSVLIPSMLGLYGLSSSESLSLYGIILGLVIPLIMFPSAIITSMTTMLLPTVSEADSNNNSVEIQLTIEKSISFCIIFGILCSAIFFKYGTPISIILFRTDYGKYIKYLGLICPFSYITATFASTINGLGNTKMTFIHSVISTIIQILSIIFLMPKIGIFGFIIALLISSVISTISHYISMYRLVHFKINLMQNCIIPIIFMMLLTYIFDTLFTIFIRINSIASFIISSFFICIIYGYIFLKNLFVNN